MAGKHRTEPRAASASARTVEGGPLARYRAELESGALEPDAGQEEVVTRLDAMAAELVRRRRWKTPSRSLFARWRSPEEPDFQGVKGLYLWGGVGRGKTHLCDLFFESLPFEDKTRLHYHRFMQRIHADLRALGKVDDPLPRIADDWAGRARLLLLDEMHVHDITNAMLLGGLLTALFRRGVTLVTTSNVPPDRLYRDGLQRARFPPGDRADQAKHHGARDAGRGRLSPPSDGARADLRGRLAGGGRAHGRGDRGGDARALHPSRCRGGGGARERDDQRAGAARARRVERCRLVRLRDSLRHAALGRPTSARSPTSSTRS